MYSRSKKKKRKRNTSIYFNANYRTDITGTNHHGLLSTSISCFKIQFVALKFFLRVRLHGGFLPNFNFFNVNP